MGGGGAEVRVRVREPDDQATLQGLCVRREVRRRCMSNHRFFTVSISIAHSHSCDSPLNWHCPQQLDQVSLVGVKGGGDHKRKGAHLPSRKLKLPSTLPTPPTGASAPAAFAGSKTTRTA